MRYITDLQSHPHRFSRPLHLPGGSALSSPSPSLTLQTHFPYATLSLAGMHARNGELGEARLALAETVRIAQEVGDQSCLQQALVSVGWCVL